MVLNLAMYFNFYRTHPSRVGQFDDFPGHVLWDTLSDNYYGVDLWVLHRLSKGQRLKYKKDYSM